MHHKFAVIDDTLLINGSLNWTQRAVLRNHENIMITSSKLFISQFLEEFENLWVMYNHNILCMQDALVKVTTEK